MFSLQQQALSIHSAELNLRNQPTLLVGIIIVKSIRSFKPFNYLIAV